MKKALSPFRVGLLVIASGAILFGFLTFARKGALDEDEATRVWAWFDDASGLAARSRVQVAGIPVGEVEKIELEGTRARVWLRLRDDVALREDAAVSKRSESLLGDYLLDLFPGSASAPPLASGGEIRRVVDAQGVDQLMGSLSEITADVREVTGALREVLGGDRGAASMEQIVENLVRLTEALDSTVRDNSGQLTTILANVEKISGDLRRATADEGELQATLRRLDRAVANLEAVTTTVKEGRGVAGRILSDEQLGQKVGNALEGISDFARRLTGLEAELSVRSEYLFETRDAKTTVGLRLIPRPDKYYLIELVDDPRGLVTVDAVERVSLDGESSYTRETRTRDALKFNVQFAQRFWFLTLRFGLIESTGGLGVDLGFPLRFPWHPRWIEDAIALKVDAFEFSREGVPFPRLRAALRFSPYRHLFVSVGVDDILNPQVRDELTHRLVSGRDVFVGAGVYFTDEDLLSILTVTGVPSL